MKRHKCSFKVKLDINLNSINSLKNRKLEAKLYSAYTTWKSFVSF